MWGVVYNDDLPYVAEQEFSTYDEAVAAAKKTARKTKEDVEIYSIHSVVKFPETDLEVETMVQTT